MLIILYKTDKLNRPDILLILILNLKFISFSSIITYSITKFIYVSDGNKSKTKNSQICVCVCVEDVYELVTL